MQPIRLLVPLALALAALAAPARAQGTPADSSHDAAVRRLMEVSRVREMTEQIGETMLKTQLEQLPQIAPFASILRDFYREQLGWATLEPEYTRLYREAFTETEVREITAFYETPLGQRILDKTPALMQKASEMTTRRVQAAMPQLIQRLQAAMQEGGAPTPDASQASKP